MANVEQGPRLDDDRAGSPPGTARVVLDLATPAALVRGLVLLGIGWEPGNPWDYDGPGLYAWTIGRDATAPDQLEQPIAYIGIGTGTKGVASRLRKEQSGVAPGYVHLHGAAMLALHGAPVGGPVTLAPEADLGWLDAALDGYHHHRGADGASIRAWLHGATLSLPEKAEGLAVRIAGQIGDCAPPLNSQFTGAWGTADPRFWAGVAVAARLRNQT